MIPEVRNARQACGQEAGGLRLTACGPLTKRIVSFYYGVGAGTLRTSARMMCGRWLRACTL